MQIVRDYAGVLVAVPMVELLPACFGSHMGDIPVRTHHRHLRAECFGTAGLPVPVEQDYLVFVPDILAA